MRGAGRDRWIATLRRLLLRPLTPLLQRWFRRHYAVARHWHRHGLDIIVQPGIFPPGPTISTSVLLDYLARRFRDGVPAQFRALDMGCGTGLVGLFLARLGAWTLATDINPAAIANARLNAAQNRLTLHAAVMDQLTALRPDRFDLIVITPPYYPRQPMGMAERAWFCGPAFDYFRHLAPQLAALDLTVTEVVMVLSEDCDLDSIASVLAEAGLSFSVLHTERRWLERTWLLRVVDQKFS